jgi:hypothetical protein
LELEDMKDADWIQQGAAQGTCLSHFLALFLAIVSRMPKMPQNLSFFCNAPTNHRGTFVTNFRCKET